MKYKNTLLILAAVLAIIWIQWPMLKGVYYKNSSPDREVKSAVAWQTDVEAAFNEAKASGKPLLLDFNASWCPPCLVMKNDVWTRPDVGELVNSRTIPVDLDVDKPESKVLAQKYGVEAIPTLILVDAKGEILARENYLTADGVKEFIAVSATADTSK